MTTIWRFQVLALVTAGLFVASTANAQQRRGGIFGNDKSSLISMAMNETVQKELGLDPETARKLSVLHRVEYQAALQAEYTTAGIVFGDGVTRRSEDDLLKQHEIHEAILAKVNDQFEPKIKDLISAEQYKRLNEIQLQSNLRFFVPIALMATAVATELKLSDEQKSKLSTLNREYWIKSRGLWVGVRDADPAAFDKLRDERTAKALDVLTAEQKTKLNTLKGKEFDVSQIGPRRPNNR